MRILVGLLCCVSAFGQYTPPSGGGSGAVWGSITGTLSSQSDLNTALAAKAPLVSPSFTTPTLGVAVATSINKVAITAPASSATLTLADGSSLITSGGNSLTFTTSGATNVTLPTSGTLATVAGTLPITGGTLTGNLLFTDATYDIGASGATRPRDFFLSRNATIGGTVNKVTITPPATGSTLTIADGKTFTASNSLAFTGTDGTSFAFPGVSSTVATLAAANAFTAAQTVTLTSIGTAQTAGASLINSTAAAAGAQQYSPALTLTGRGWKTDATAESQQVDWNIQTQPIQDAANPLAFLAFRSQVNGGGYGLAGGFARYTAGTFSGFSQLHIGSTVPTAAGTSGLFLYGGSSGTGGLVFSGDLFTLYGAALGMRMQISGTDINFGSGGTAVVAGATGLISKYGTITTAGRGVVGIFGSVPLTGQTASIGATNIQCGGAVCAAGTYEVTVYTVVTTTGSGTLTTTIGYTDPAAARTITSAGISTAATNFEQNTYVIRTDGIANITYSTTLSATGTYSIYVTVKRTQ